jgi:hypothetical protein
MLKANIAVVIFTFNVCWGIWKLHKDQATGNERDLKGVTGGTKAQAAVK